MRDEITNLAKGLDEKVKMLSTSASKPKAKARSFFSSGKGAIDDIKMCHTVAKQTVKLCASTLDTSKDLVACGETIQSSLLGAASDISAESFAVIADLIDGDKTKEARDLAVTMKNQSTECISLSMRMITSLEHSVDALPDFVENYVEKKANESVTDDLTAEERQLAIRGVDDDTAELTRCIDAIKDLKLLTAIEAGTRSFEAIKEKSRLCHRIFETIKRFAADVLGITDAIADKDVSTIISKVKDGSILRAIGLSKYMKQFAEGCKAVMDKIIELFQGASGKLSTLWRALSHAKDVMVDSLNQVVSARSLCDEAGEKAEKLKEMTESLCNTEAAKMIKSFTGGDKSMNEAEHTARGVDVSIEDAALRMKNAAKMVRDEFHSLPSIITDGITDDTDDEVARSFGNNEVRDIDGDVSKLERATKSIEDANIIDAAMSIRREIKNIPDKVDMCKDMIVSCGNFADKSTISIDSFLGKWSLEDAVSKIMEMCRLVSIAKLMEELADQIHRLMKAITNLLHAMSAKIQSAADQLEGGFDSMVDAAEDIVSGGWKKLFGKG